MKNKKLDEKVDVSRRKFVRKIVIAVATAGVSVSAITLPKNAQAGKCTPAHPCCQSNGSVQ